MEKGLEEQPASEEAIPFSNTIEKPIPLGIGQEKLGKNAETLPAVPVDNKVAWVNPHMKLPFKIEEGKPTDLIAFFTSRPKEGEKIRHLEVAGIHKRSGLVGRVVFQDTEGRLYRDIDQKGGGGTEHVLAGVEDGRFRKEFSVRKFAGERKGDSPYGLLAHVDHVTTDRDMAEVFLANDIRTYRVVAIVELEEIVIGDGDKVSVEKAREEGLLQPKDKPLIEVRAFGTKARVREAHDLLLLEDAISLVSQEVGRKLSPAEYMEWFSETLGTQIAKMHNLGYFHRSLNNLNVTLDCRIVDLGSVMDRRTAGDYGIEYESAVEANYREAKAVLDPLYPAIAYLMGRLSGQSGLPSETSKNYYRLFEDAYASERKEKVG